MVHGKDLILSIDGTVIAAAKSCDLDLQTDFIEVCSPIGGQWKNYIPTTNSWGCSASALCTTMEYFDQLEQLWHDRTKVTLRFWDEEMWCLYKGYAYISNLKTSGPVGSLVSLQAQFQTLGELEKAVRVEIDPEHDQSYLYEEMEMFWALTGCKRVYIKDKMTAPVVDILVKEITVTARTRFHLVDGVVIGKPGIEDAISDHDSEEFNKLALGYARNGETLDIILPAGTYEVCVNDENYQHRGRGSYYVSAI